MTAAEVGRAGSHILAKAVFPADLRSLVTIRGFVEKWANEVGLGEEPTFRIKLAVSEACANAIEHPAEKSDITVWAWQREDRFTVDVWSAGEFRISGDRSPSYSRGFGLPLMVACADEVTFACMPEGGVRAVVC